MPTLKEKEVYALTHALDTDLSRLIKEALGGQSSPLTVQQTQRAKKRLRERGVADVERAPWQVLLDSVSFTGKCSILQTSIAILSRHLGVEQQRMIEFHSTLKKSQNPRNGAAHSGQFEDEDYETMRFEGSLLYVDYPEFDLHEFRKEWKLIRDPNYVEQVIIPDDWREKKPIVNNLPEKEDDKIGFVGRTKDLENLKGLLRGNRPVITVTAAGGMGKTALALECLHQVVHPDSSFPFDRVYWISLKTTRFDVEGVADIHTALKSPNVILNTLQSELSSVEQGKNSELKIEEATQSLLGILQEQRILLVIDNIESIDWGQVEPLLHINSGRSKILLTSRLALNQGDIPYHLREMEQAHGVELLQKSLQSLNVDGEPSYETLLSLCTRLFFNPLAIRWFALSRAKSESIEKLLQINGDLGKVLEFCFDTAFESLEERHREYLKIFVAIDKPLSQVQIALLLESDDIDQVYSDLQHLSRSSFVHLSTDEWASGRGDLWKMSEAARQFLISQNESADPQKSRLLQGRYNNLKGLRDMANANYHLHGPFGMQSFNPRTTDEALIVHVLEGAIKAARNADRTKSEEKRGYLDKALSLVKQAESLLPTYYDVWRVSAQVHAAAGDPIKTVESFEKALQMAHDEKEVVLFHYAKFLMTADKALALNLLSSVGVDSSPQLLLLLSEVQWRTKRYKEAVTTCECIKARPGNLNNRELEQVTFIHFKSLIEVARLSFEEFDKLEILHKALNIAIETAKKATLGPEFRDVIHICVQDACFVMARQQTDEAYPPAWFVFQPLLKLLGERVSLVAEQMDGLGALQERYPQVSGDVMQVFYPPRVGAKQGGGYVRPIEREGNTFKHHGLIEGDDGVVFYFHKTEILSLETNGGWKKFCRKSFGKLRVQFSIEPPLKEGRLPTAVAVTIEKGASQQPAQEKGVDKKVPLPPVKPIIQPQVDAEVMSAKTSGAEELEGVVRPFTPGKLYTYIDVEDSRNFMLSRLDFKGILWEELQQLGAVRVRFSPDDKGAKDVYLIGEEA